MTYQLYTPVGSAHAVTPITVPDNVIDAALYDSANKIGVQLVGRNAIDYGTAVAQNTVQMVSNFAGTVLPNDTIALQGQLWFNVTNGGLYIRTTSNVSGGILNWRKISVINSATPADGDILVSGSVISIYAAGAYRQVFPPLYQ